MNAISENKKVKSVEIYIHKGNTNAEIKIAKRGIFSKGKAEIFFSWNNKESEF